MKLHIMRFSKVFRNSLPLKTAVCGPKMLDTQVLLSTQKDQTFDDIMF